MTNLASIYQYNSRDNRLLVASIASQIEDVFLISYDDRFCTVKVANSCLVYPELGDAVLVFLSENDNSSYIISVLCKSTSGSSTLRLPGGSIISTDRDQLKFEAGRIEISSKKSIGLSSPVLNVSAFISNIAIEFLRGKLNYAKAFCNKVSFAANIFKSSYDRIVQHSRYSSITVAETLSTKAGCVKTAVKNNSSLYASHVNVIAENCVRIDGEKIDLG